MRSWISVLSPSSRRARRCTGNSAVSRKTTHVTTSQASFRQLWFGINDNRESPWVDCGWPGNAVLAFALAAHADWQRRGAR